MKTILILAITAITTAVSAQQIQPSVSVTGEGKVIAVPDEVTIRMGVQNEGKDPKTVKTENDAAVDKVLDYLIKMGIPQNQVQTEYVNLNKNYDYNTKTYNYNASQTISVELKDLSKYDKLMSGLVASGINSINGVSFSSSKMEEYEAEARKKAVLNAKQKAEAYAGVLGQNIGKALLIAEQGTSSPQPQPMYKMAVAESMDSGRNTIAPGEITVTSTIQVSFELVD
ncbi:SIMPL domain-containing protein [Leeuwenhoekiella nanhaiensis]|uniref:SIMPL domain-containing protein n=1 Tax=Leeuwenhoekiella nanhaiensis TaxID=1655491 RepID=A0A2G1VNZ8_9FLAO|nr:SIMPL domain-containing protein [Leeuwenhoekiella nanhaiensis]PHQ28496.1 SIMPL domain-containing protein [Leeuwenhoekiella nanhaiensis]